MRRSPAPDVPRRPGEAVSVRLLDPLHEQRAVREWADVGAAITAALVSIEQDCRERQQPVRAPSGHRHADRYVPGETLRYVEQSRRHRVTGELDGDRDRHEAAERPDDDDAPAHCACCAETRCRVAVRAAGGDEADTSGDSTEPSPYPPGFVQLKCVAMDDTAPDCAVCQASSTLVLLTRSERSATDHGEDQGEQPRRRARRRRDDAGHLEADPRAADTAVRRRRPGVLRPRHRAPRRDRRPGDRRRGQRDQAPWRRRQVRHDHPG